MTHANTSCVGAKTVFCLRFFAGLDLPSSLVLEAFALPRSCFCDFLEEDTDEDDFLDFLEDETDTGDGCLFFIPFGLLFGSDDDALFGDTDLDVRTSAGWKSC